MSAVSDKHSVLVVGGTSFIGARLLPVLCESEADIYATVRPGLAVPVHGRVRWIASDLTASDATAAWPERCSTVVYLAQSRAWRSFPEGAADVFAVNVRTLFAALEYARTAGVTRFIFASTGSVYDEGDAPARETDAIRVTTARPLYVASKLSAELMLRAYSNCFHAICLRLFVPYGAGQSPQMLIPGLVRRVIDGEPIHLDGSDGLRINPVAVSDVVEALRRCLALDQSATFNVAGPTILTLREIGCRIGEMVGRDPKFEQCSRAARTIAGDNSALRAAIGWAPETMFPHGLRA